MLTQRMIGLVRIAETANADIDYITEEVINLSGACRGTIFCVDDETNEMYFKVDTPGGKLEIRMPILPTSIAGNAILNNHVINIPDCYKDSRFDPKVDKATGFHTKQMLCVPVSDRNGKVVGAIPLLPYTDI